jgi:hypothetical protein
MNNSMRNYIDNHIDIMNNDNDDNRLKIVNIIKRISQNCILFIIINVHSDDEQVKFHEKILHDIIDDDYLPIHRILFYETDIGKIAIVRQLNPNIYFDNHSFFCCSLILFELLWIIFHQELSNSLSMYSLSWSTKD